MVIKNSNVLTAGIVLLVIRGGLFFRPAPKMDVVRSGLGQLAAAFSQSAAQEMQTYQIAYCGGIVGMVLGTVCILGGILQRGKD